MELKIKKKTIEFESKSIYIIIIDFGISFYVWIGKYPNLEFLCVTFPVSNNKSQLDNFVSSSLLEEDEICTSISSYLCKILKRPILTSINTDNIEINSKNINEFKQIVNRSVIDLIRE